MTQHDLGVFFEQTKIPYMLISRDGTVCESNEAAQSILQYVLPDMQSRWKFGIDIRPLFKKLVPLKEKKIIIEAILYRKDFFSTDIPLTIGNLQEKHWFSFHATRTNDDRYFCIFYDVTKQKQREHDLEQAKENADRRSSIRNQFFANVSHEIRTPIQTITGTMELLNETSLDKEQLEYSRQVCFSADVLLSLVNDILDFSKIESGQFSIEHIEFNLIRQIEQTVDIISMEAHMRNLEIIIDIHPQVPTFVIGDPYRLQQILLNLVKNAVKFTEKGHVLVYVYPKDGNEVSTIVFEVVDTGIGIDEQAQLNLFSAFYQADASTTRRYGGTGLGLAISKNLVDLMHGSIRMYSNTPHGSVFSFELPFEISIRDKEIDKFNSTCIIPPSARFLLVDDNIIALRCLEGKLAVYGCTQITLAESGEEALIRMRTQARIGDPYDIVFIDMIMPEMDGWRLAAEINSDHLINSVQLYLMVPEGKIGGEAKMKLLEWFNAYIYKPIKQELLYDLLREHYKPSIDLEVVEELLPVQGNAKTCESDIHAVATLCVSATSSENDAKLAQGKIIVIVEDHPVNQKLLKVFLEKFGVQVLTANNGKEAIDVILSQENVDLVFMDIQMPIMNGIEASRVLRTHLFASPIIACTANMEADEFVEYYEAGMNAVLTKPFKKQEVKDMLTCWLLRPSVNNTTDIQTTVLQGENTMTVSDFTTFLEIIGYDYDLTFQIIDDFIAQTERLLIQGDEAISSNDIKSLGLVGHSIKGSSASICAVPLSIEAKKVEFAGKDGNMDEAQRTFLHVKSLFSQFCSESAAWKQENNALFSQ